MQSVSVVRRALAAVVLSALLLVPLASPAAAQLPSFDDLPVAPDGAIGALLDPLEDLIEQITAPLGDAVCDIPLDNAVRLCGEDAVGASVVLSQATFETADFVMVGRDDVFADSLSSVAAQGIAGAPLLLTQTDGLDPRVVEEFTRLGTTQVLILGSVHAIAPETEAQLVEIFGADNVARVGGPSRVETAALLADHIAPQATHAILMRAYPEEGVDQAQAYADALAAGPLGSQLEYPALLTTTDYLHPAAEAFFASSGVTNVVVVGGEAAIAPSVVEELEAMGITVERVAGQNRWGTAIEIARFMGFLDAADTSRLILTEAGSIAEPLWSAGFAAAAHGAVYEAPVILADGPLLPPETLAYLGDGLVSNALRLSNLPLICNTWVDILACETAALLMLGLLDEVNRMTDGLLEQVLGPVFEQLQAVLEQVLPGSDGTSPGLVGQILSLLGVSGDDEVGPGEDGTDCDGDGDTNDTECPSEPTVAYNAAMDSQPAEVQAAFEGLMGPSDDRISTSRQAALLVVFTALNDALGAPVDTSDPAQAAALVTVIDSIAAVLGFDAPTLPTGELNDLLVGMEDLLGGVVDADALAELSDLVAGLGVDSPDDVTGIVTDVSGALGGTSFTADGDLTDRWGDQAAELEATLNRLTS